MIMATGQQAMLKVSGLCSHYGWIQALHGVDLAVAEGELVALVGANGAGKTTLLRTLCGLQKASAGSISMQDRDITHLAAERRVRLGIAQVPEGRQVFGPMSVQDNLELGAYSRPAAEMRESLDQMYAMFPVLTVIGILIGRILSGAFIVETIFNIPGIGRLGVTAVLQRDYPVILGSTLSLAFAFLVSTFLVDILYGLLDPRIRVADD